MKEFLKRKGLLIGLIAVVIAAITVISLFFAPNRASFLANATNTVMRPVETGIKHTVDFLEKLYGYLYRYDLLEAENEALRAENAALKELQREAEAANAENADLREQLGLKERSADYDTVYAPVTAWSASNWASSFTIGKGSADDIEVGDPVMDSSGALVGQVAEVGGSWATVRSILDTETSIGAVASGSVGAIAMGDFELMHQGYLKLDYVPTGTELYIGDTVLSSGAGEVFPKGLVIGEILSVETTESGASSYAIIRPAADFSSLKAVFVIKAFELSE